MSEIPTVIIMLLAVAIVCVIGIIVYSITLWIEYIIAPLSSKIWKWFLYRVEDIGASFERGRNK